MASKSPFKLITPTLDEMSPKVITLTPAKEIKMPKTARRDGFNLKTRDDTNMDQMGVVFTNTVAFKIVVSDTAETKNMKCKPNKTPRTKICERFFLKRFLIRGLRNKIRKIMRKMDAITRRQRAFEKTFKPSRRRKNMAPVPKSAPAVIPSKRAAFLFLFDRLSAPTSVL